MNEASCDVLVLGAGPAGMAAADAASAAGRQVIVVDDNPGPGGQIWRRESNRSIARFLELPVERWHGAQLVDLPTPQLAQVVRGGQLWLIKFRALVLATGARERFLPFPGWTLPEVMGAGGLQALVKGGLPISGKRVIVAGTGPLLLAVAAYLRGKGANLPAVCDQAPSSRLFRLGLSLLPSFDKLSQGAKLLLQMLPAWPRAGVWPLRAEGKGKLEAVVLTDGNKEWSVPCDYLACGYHLVPNIEVGQLLGCQVEDERLLHDANMRTSVPHVFCAGEVAGIGGVDVAEAEGRRAGEAAAEWATSPEPPGEFSPLPLSGFRKKLASTYALRPELKALPTEETILCRCEDQLFGTVRGSANWREAKLQHRCGMGPCQGRVCGPAVSFLLGFPPTSVRPPLYPIPVGTWRDEPEPNP